MPPPHGGRTSARARWRALVFCGSLAVVAAAAQTSRTCASKDVVNACGSARRSSVGDCLVCLHSASALRTCTVAHADAFCSGDTEADNLCSGTLPCLNGGTCEARARGYSCHCAAGWGGADCAVAVDCVATAPAAPGFGKVGTCISGVTAAGLAFVEAALPKQSQKGEWRRCYDSRSDCTSCPSDSSPDGSSPCSCAANTTSFHSGCDAHAETLVLGHNTLVRDLGQTFGGYAMATWSGAPTPSHSSYATEATGDFLFQLGPAAAATYPARGHNGIPGGDNCYQHRATGYWPIWGTDDLVFGWGGTLGNNGHCNKRKTPGYTYEGLGQEVCGGNYNWGPTEMEVWYRVNAQQQQQKQKQQQQLQGREGLGSE